MPKSIVISCVLSLVISFAMFNAIENFCVSIQCLFNKICASGDYVRIVRCGVFSDISDAIESIRQSVEAIKQFIDSLLKFFGKIWDGIYFVVTLLGIEVILFLIGVMLVSSVLTIIGIQRGKLSFFLSLCFVNYIWIVARESFDEINVTFIMEVVKTNAIVLLPFVTVQLGTRYFPLLKKKLMFLRVKLRNHNAMTIENAVDYLQNLKAVQNDFECAYLNDVKASENGKVIFSNETRRLANEIEELLRELMRK